MNDISSDENGDEVNDYESDTDDEPPKRMRVIRKRTNLFEPDQKVEELMILAVDTFSHLKVLFVENTNCYTKLFEVNLVYARSSSNAAN